MTISETIKTFDWRHAASQALWTLLFAHLAASLVFLGPIVDGAFTTSWDGALAVAVSATIAGIAAILSLLKTIIFHIVKQIKKNKSPKVSPTQ